MLLCFVCNQWGTQHFCLQTTHFASGTVRHVMSHLAVQPLLGVSSLLLRDQLPMWDVMRRQIHSEDSYSKLTYWWVFDTERLMLVALDMCVRACVKWWCVMALEALNITEACEGYDPQFCCLNHIRQCIQFLWSHVKDFGLRKEKYKWDKIGDQDLNITIF